MRSEGAEPVAATSAAQKTRGTRVRRNVGPAANKVTAAATFIAATRSAAPSQIAGSLGASSQSAAPAIVATGSQNIQRSRRATHVAVKTSRNGARLGECAPAVLPRARFSNPEPPTMSVVTRFAPSPTGFLDRKSVV